ncbi:MAG TPA: rhodanese-like domain-containing protein [Vicinamibacteria bacterium]|nr:rhodanese-like domain-containing protein [Vicinamibacteria bacterium]
MRTACLVLLLSSAAINVSAQQYPLRAKYPDLVPISTEQLAHAIGSAVVIDVRSEFEFSVMHVDGAVHVDLAGTDFVGRLSAAVGADRSKMVVTYCNGQTCEKSYEGAEAAQKAGFSRVRVYDAGILEWARMARGRTLLFGKAVQPQQIIPESRYEAHLADAATFERGASAPGAVLIDVRDAQQRAKTAEFARKAEWLSVDRLVRELDAAAFRSRYQDKTLYIFDNVGKQVRWVQYALEAKGYSRYVFLKDGMAGLVGGR